MCKYTEDNNTHIHIYNEIYFSCIFFMYFKSLPIISFDVINIRGTGTPVDLLKYYTFWRQI